MPQLYQPTQTADRFSIVRSASDSFALQIASGEPSLFQLAKLSGSSDTVLVLLCAHIAEANRFLKVANALTNDEIRLAAEEVYNEYKCFFTFADVVTTLRNAKLGKYGKDLYNRLSAADVVDWFRQYQLEKDSAVVNYRVKENSEHRKFDPKNLPYHFENGRIILNKPLPDTPSAPSKPKSVKDQEYQSFKEDQIYHRILSKPDADRTPSELQFLSDYRLSRHIKE